MAFNMKLVNSVVEHFNATQSTTRKTAEHFGISKDTVYRYLTKVHPNDTSAEILKKNKAERSSRAGRARQNKPK